MICRALGAKVIVEFHEAQDVGEARLPLAAKYMNIGGRYLLSCPLVRSFIPSSIGISLTAGTD